MSKAVLRPLNLTPELRARELLREPGAVPVPVERWRRESAVILRYLELRRAGRLPCGCGAPQSLTGCRKCLNTGLLVLYANDGKYRIGGYAITIEILGHILDQSSWLPGQEAAPAPRPTERARAIAARVCGAA